MIKRLPLPRLLRALMGSVGTWSFGWGFFRIIKDELYVLGITSMVFGATLLVLAIMSQERSKGLSTPTEGKEKRYPSSRLQPKRGKRRFNRLLAAIAAAIAGFVAMFWRSGTCTDIVAVAGECSLGSSPSTIIMAVLLWGLAVWLLYVWWSDTRRA